MYRLTLLFLALECVCVGIAAVTMCDDRITLRRNEYMSLNVVRVPYDATAYDFRTLLRTTFEVDDLEALHLALDSNRMTGEEKSYFNEQSTLGSTDRSSVFVKSFLRYFDTDYTFLHAYLNFLAKEIKPLFPEEEKILVQKTPNLRVHLPGHTAIGSRESDPSEEVVGLHTDRELGHPEGTINVVIPLTEMRDTNTIFYESEDSSENKGANNYVTLDTTSMNEFFMINLYSKRHFNRINTTGKTRVSMDVRVVPFSSYKGNAHPPGYSVTHGKAFVAGDYYMFL